MLLTQYFSLIFSSILHLEAHVSADNKIKNGVLKWQNQKLQKKH